MSASSQKEVVAMILAKRQWNGLALGMLYNAWCKAIELPSDGGRCQKGGAMNVAGGEYDSNSECKPDLQKTARRAQWPNQ